MEFKVGILLGRLANGFQSDHGSLYHAVAMLPHKRPRCPFNDFGKKVIENDNFETMKSLCGKVPGRKSVGWHYGDEGKVVTCPRCLKKIQKLEEKS